MKNIGNVKDYEKEDLRFATPLNVAIYRADDLKCSRIVDLCSGIGIQAKAFAKTCDSVLGIELDKRKIEVSKKNFGNIKNLRFEEGDVLDDRIIEIVRKFKPDIIFCDPERLASEKERNLESIKPNLLELIKIYREICKNICIEIPPRIDFKKLKELGDIEAEYLCVDNKLNRLDLKFGDLKKNERSVVDVHSGIRIVNGSFKKIKSSDKVLDCIYEVSESIVKADLINELGSLINAYFLKGCEKNKVLLTSNELDVKFDCFAKPYFVIDIVNDIRGIRELLLKKRFGKVVLKYSIDPKEYWKERNSLESGLIGNREGVVFKINGKYVVCENR